MLVSVGYVMISDVVQCWELISKDFPTNAVAYNACLALLPWHGAMHVLKLIRFQQLRVTARGLACVKQKVVTQGFCN